MPQISIIMPQLGESIAEATIISFLVQPGDTVEADQNLIEATKEEAARLGLDVPATRKNSETEHVSKTEANIRSGRVQPTVRGLPVPASAAGASYLSPRLKAR